MKKEIGSEFWYQEKCECLYTKELNLDESFDSIFLLSGRTALDYIIRDAIKTYGVKRAWVPEYCCHTMIEPFVSNGICVEFYEVNCCKAGGLHLVIPEKEGNEIILVLNYFGYIQNSVDIERLKRRGNIIIQDNTHDCFSRIHRSDLPQYSFASYRKWTFFKGVAKAVKNAGKFVNGIEDDRRNLKYLILRQNAAETKGKYMAGVERDKRRYLSFYSQAEEMLEHDYRNYLADKEDVDNLLKLDIELIRKKRRENAYSLMEQIKNIQHVTSLFSILKEYECPLCVPILVEDGKRDLLRKYLITKNIYLPVHWPVSSLHKGDSSKKIYASVLSLVCDQRYGAEEMNRIVFEIRRFFGD